MATMREACGQNVEDYPEAEAALKKQGDASAEGTRWDGGTARDSCASHSPRITAPMNKLVTTRNSQNSL